MKYCILVSVAFHAVSTSLEPSYQTAILGKSLRPVPSATEVTTI